MITTRNEKNLPAPHIRKARLADIPAIHRLLQDYSRKGELLPRPLSKLYDHIRDFFVAEEERTGRVLGCCALQFCWEDLAEIRSLAVHPEFTRKGIGSRLARVAIEEANTYNVKKIFTLTYRPGFFARFGFVQIDRSELPYKIWADCMMCVKFPDCDEIAMLHQVNEAPRTLP